MQKNAKIVLKKFVEWKDDILHLIYPSTCLICEKENSKNEQNICFFCLEDLKFTQLEKYSEESSLDKLFWGRCKIETTYGLLYFEKGNQTQQILHQIKYKNKQNLGIMMGKLIGERLLDKAKYETIEAYIPVPLHLKKKHTRGYNQSELIANGISEITKIPVNTEFLTRVVHAESQTKKGRFKRWDNINEAFHVTAKEKFEFKHIALIDDVTTTGSTLESCVKTIQEVYPELKISIICLAITK